MLDIELRRALLHLSGQEAADGGGLVFQEPLGALVLERPDGDDGEAFIQLHGWQRIPRGAADEGALEVRMRDALRRADEARAELRAGRPHLEVGEDRFPPPDAAGHEDRHVADMRQDFLRQDVQADRADMPAGLAALDHQRIGAGTHQLLRQRQRGGEADDLRAAILRRLDRRPRRDAASEDDVPHLVRQAHLHELIQLRMHGDQVHAEGFSGQRLGRCDLLRQPLRLHCAAGDDAKGPGIGQRRHQIAFADPGHRPAHDGVGRAEEGRAARHQRIDPCQRPRGGRAVLLRGVHGSQLSARRAGSGPSRP